MSLDLTAIRQANAARRARQEVATPGPWKWDESDEEWRGMIGHYSLHELTPDPQDSIPVLVPAPVNAYGNEIPPGIMAVIGVTPEDRDFIATARSDDAPAVIDQLVAEVERLRAGLEKLRFEHDQDCVAFAPGKPVRCECFPYVSTGEYNAKINQLLNQTSAIPPTEQKS